MKYTEIDQNRIIILQKTYNPGALHQTDTQTDIRQRFTHFLSGTPVWVANTIALWAIKEIPEGTGGVGERVSV